MLVFEKVLLW